MMSEGVRSQVVVMSLIIGSLFGNQHATPGDARNFFGVSFLSIMFLSMGAMPEMGITFSYKPCAPLPSFHICGASVLSLCSSSAVFLVMEALRETSITFPCEAAHNPAFSRSMLWRDMT